MIAYIKDRSTFATLDMMLDITEFTLVLGAVNNNVGTAVALGELEGLENQFFIYDNKLWIIKGLSPEDGTTTVTLEDISYLFSRDLVWTDGTTYASIEACIASTIDTEYINLTDPYYDTPYITVTYSTSTGFVKPDVEEGLWNLKGYIAKVRRMKNVFLTYSISGDQLNITVEAKTPTVHKIDFATDVAQMSQETYQKNSVAKITVNGINTYYLYNDGTYGTNASPSLPLERVEGDWIQLNVSAYDNEADKVADTFALNAESHIVEFWTELPVEFYDTVIIRHEGRVVSGTISLVEITSSDSRRFCKTGDLIDTMPEAISVLSERIEKVTKTVERSTASGNIQGDLHVSGDIYEQGAKLATRYQSNRNLLDNAYFIGGGSQNGYGVFPINQRGQGSYNSDIGYSIDRWRMRGASAVTLNSSGITFTGYNGFQGIMQNMPNKEQVLGKTITFSVLITAVTGSGFGSLLICDATNSGYAGTYLARLDFSTTGLHSLTFEIPSSITNNYLNFFIGSIATESRGMTIAACKVEYGTTQTLAHQENGSWVLNEIPDYGEELRKCQAYLVPILGNTVRWSPSQITANIIDVTIPVAVPLAKTQPTIVGTTPTVYYNGTAQTGFTFAFTDRGIEMLNSPTVVLRCTKNSHGLSASGNIMVGASTSTTFASAEP